VANESGRHRVPYLTPERRFEFLCPTEDPELLDFLRKTKLVDGDLNYLITHLIGHWLVVSGKNYANINTAIGVLEGTKLELYRRIAAPYEDTNIVANGDAYPKELLQ
jgi:hypothetical protein